MPEFSTDFSAAAAAVTRADGFVDFYEMLGVPGDASSDLINARINDLYTRAQNNREHRHLAKRREAEVLLSLMPHCMDVLCAPENRAAYDSYAVAARAGAAPTDFETFMNEVVKESQSARSGLLGLRDEGLAGALATNGASNGSSSNGSSANGAASSGAWLNGASGKAASSLNGKARAAKAASSGAASVARPARHVSAPTVSWARVGGAFALVFVLSDLGFSAPSWVTLSIASLAALLTLSQQRRALARQRANRNAQV